MKAAYVRRKAYEWTDSRIQDEAENAGLELVPITYSQPNSISMVRGIDVLYFRALGKQYNTASAMLDEAGDIPVIDEYITQGPLQPRTKYSMHKKLLAANVPSPVSTIRSNIGDVSIVKPCVFGPQYPFILKYDTGGRRGLGTFLIREHEDISRVSDIIEDRSYYEKEGRMPRDSKWLTQKYIPNVGDYRAMVIDYKCIGITKRKAKRDELVQTTSEGNSSRYKDGRWPKNVAKVAEAAAKAVQVQVAGVDLVRDKNTGEIYIIEVNEAPAFEIFERRSGVNVAKYIVAMLKEKAEKHVRAQAVN